jgi:predicted ATP-grasp superfamily ATP-dependent carboligase
VMNDLPCKRMAAVLLCGDEFHATLAGVRGLHAGGHVPYVALSTRRTYASYSRYTAATVEVPDPDLDPVAYTKAIGEAAVKIGAGAILPGTESSLVVLSRNSTAIPANIAIGIPSLSTVMAAVDKTSVVEFAERAGLQTPPSRTTTREDLLLEASRFDYPLILKPLRSKLPTGEGTMRYFQARRIETPEQLLRVLTDAPHGPWVVQPYFQAELSAIGGVAWRGTLVCAVHQVAQRIWPPYAGYSSYAKTVTPDESLEEAARYLLAQVEWSGVFQIQFIRVQRDCFFIDFNPRLYGSIALAMAAGRNLPAIWADLVLGREPKVSSYRPGVRYRLEHNDARAIAWLLTTGAAGAGLRGLVPRRNTVHGIFSLGDPGPLRTWLFKAAARASPRLVGLRRTAPGRPGS